MYVESVLEKIQEENGLAHLSSSMFCVVAMEHFGGTIGKGGGRGVFS